MRKLALIAILLLFPFPALAQGEGTPDRPRREMPERPRPIVNGHDLQPTQWEVRGREGVLPRQDRAASRATDHILDELYQEVMRRSAPPDPQR